jgi:hypothetical protein
MTLFSHVAESWFNHSPVTGSPRKTGTEANILPKNHSSASAGFATKKIKEKTRGPVNALALPSPKRFAPFKLDDAPETKFNTKTKPAASKLKPNPNTTQPKPVHDSSKPYRCIICNNEVVEAERRKHFNGRPHKQTFGMLDDYRKRHILNKALPRPDTKPLRVAKDEWRCPPCGNESMPYPFEACIMQKHLVEDRHEKALGKLWRNLKSMLGLQDMSNEAPEIPQDFESTFRRISRRLSGFY